MKACWRKPSTIKLAEKLSELNANLQNVVPLLVSAQVEAVKRMAETVMAVHGKSVEGKAHE